jgi:hypothetical protein
MELHREKLRQGLNPEESRKLDERLAQLVEKMEYISKQTRALASHGALPAATGPRIIEWRPQTYQFEEALGPDTLVAELFEPLD